MRFNTQASKRQKFTSLLLSLTLSKGALSQGAQADGPSLSPTVPVTSYFWQQMLDEEIDANNQRVDHHLQLNDHMLKKLEVYEDIMAEGCFFCSSRVDDALLLSDKIDYDHDHCVDICAEGVIDKAHWGEITGKGTFIGEKASQFDDVCTQVILSSLGDLVTESGAVQSGELTEFAENLIFDERSQICFAYDPRDALQRRFLQIKEDQCYSMDCFDCSFTGGFCAWEPQKNSCFPLYATPEERLALRSIRWWQWFEFCPDELSLCDQSGSKRLSPDKQSYKKALDDGEIVSFSIKQLPTSRSIPANYFCRWNVNIESDLDYQLSIRRNFFPLQEQLELKITGGEKQQLVKDNELASQDPDIEWERFALVKTDNLEIFARNKDRTKEQSTFQITLKLQMLEESSSAFASITSLLMLALFCCLCLACCTVFLRLRCKLRHEHRIDANLQGMAEAQGGDVDAETYLRNQRIAAVRAQGNNAGISNRQQREQDRERMAVVIHESLVERYKKLIPLLKFKKNDKTIDEFNTPECVICMEAFVNGVKVRKVPSCKHIFHDDCLMKWLSGSQQQEAQKCPMCNSDITPAILEKAIFEEASAKKDKKLAIKKQPARAQIQMNASEPYRANASQQSQRSRRQQDSESPDIMQLVSMADESHHQQDVSSTHLQVPRRR